MASNGGKSRKFGRNAKKCKRYQDERREEKSKIRKIAKNERQKARKREKIKRRQEVMA